MILILAILLATIVSWLVIPFMWKHALQLGFVDEPDSRKVHHKPIARVGGWGIVLGALFSIVLLLPMKPVYQAYVMGSVVLLLFGAWDDRRESGHYTKFFGQFLAVIPIVTYGGLYVKTLPFMNIDSLPAYLGIPFTAIAMIGVINALNHSDGLDGLAGGESLISLVAIAFLAYIYDGFPVLVIACAGIGGILGFLRYNAHPAHVFMGDSGSQFLGFTLSFLVVMLTQQVNPALSPALPLLLLGLPVIDIVAVLFLRIKGGMNWFRATKNHIHHRLLNLGFDHYESVVLIYSIHALFVISAIFLRYEWEYSIIAEYIGLIVLLFFTLSFVEKKGWHFSPINSGMRLNTFIKNQRYQTFKQEAPIFILALGVPLFLIKGGVTAFDVTPDVAIASLLLIFIFVWSFVKDKAQSVVSRMLVYSTGIFVVFLNLSPSPQNILNNKVEVIFFVILAITVMFAIRYSQKESFQTTPTDYLILFLILLITATSGIDYEQVKVSTFVVKAVILLYAMELIIYQQNRWLKLLLFCSMLDLAFIFTKGAVSYFT